MIKYLFIILFTLTMNSYAENPTAKLALEKVNNGALLIDNRTEAEFNEGHLNNALLIPYDVIAEKITAVTADKTKEIVLYCRSGGRSGKALQTLKELGYQNVLNAGGYEDLKDTFK